MSDEQEKFWRENVQQNFVKTAQQNPNIDFYYFIAPYSVAYWGNLSTSHSLSKELALQKTVIETLLECPNIHVFSFSDMEDITCDLSHYSDTYHYSEDINSKILKFMKSDVGRLTKENYQEYLARIEKFYTNYNYESLNS